MPTVSDFIYATAKMPDQAEQKIKDRLGVKSLAFSHLGTGSWGSAFNMGGGKVLKLTRDQSEAVTMSIVRDAPCKQIVQVIDVFQLPPSIMAVPTYGIVQEKLSSPSGDWATFMGLISSVVFDKGFAGGLNKKRMLRLLQELARNRQDDDDYLPDFTDEKVEWLYQLAMYFESQSIVFYDFHAGNIMKGKRGHVLIDLGQSKSPGHHVDVAEQIKEFRVARFSARQLVESLCTEGRGLDSRALKGLFKDLENNCKRILPRVYVSPAFLQYTKTGFTSTVVQVSAFLPWVGTTDSDEDPSVQFRKDQAGMQRVRVLMDKFLSKYADSYDLGDVENPRTRPWGLRIEGTARFSAE